MADEQRTERATPRRREKARERGQLVRSRELPSALTLLAVAALLRWANGGFLPAWSGLLRHLLATGSRADLASMASILDWTAWGIARWVLPPLGLAWGVSVMGLITQGGFVVTPLAFQPKWDRLNPVNNISRMFSLGSLSTLLKSLVPVGVLLYLAVGILSRDWLQVTHTSQMGLPAALSWLAQVLYEFAWKGGMVLLVWAGVDYALQKANYERSMRMSKQEIRDEHRDLEGKPGHQGEDQAPLPRNAPQKNDAAGRPRHRRDHQPGRIRRRARIRSRKNGRAAGPCQGPRRTRAEDQARGALVRSPHHREQAARAGALSHGRSGRNDSRQALYGGGRSPRVHLPRASQGSCRGRRRKPGRKGREALLRIRPEKIPAPAAHGDSDTSWPQHPRPHLRR